MKVLSKSTKQTQKIAQDYAKTLKSGDIVLLYGDMGAGKTVFAKGFAKGLNITNEIVSPTYNYVYVYDEYFYHFDLYKINGAAHAKSLGIDEYFYSGGICLVEWPQNILELIPDNCKKVFINKITKNTREIVFED